MQLMNLLLISLRKSYDKSSYHFMYIPTYTCTMFSAFPLITMCQPSTPPSVANPSTWALNSIHPLSHMECLISFNYLFPQGINNCPLSSPCFYYHTRQSFLPCWKIKSLKSLDLISHTSYGQILHFPWWSTSLSRVTYTCLQFVFLSWTLCNEAFTPTIPSVIILCISRSEQSWSFSSPWNSSLFLEQSLVLFLHHRLLLLRPLS